MKRKGKKDKKTKGGKPDILIVLFPTMPGHGFHTTSSCRQLPSAAAGHVGSKPCLKMFHPAQGLVC